MKDLRNRTLILSTAGSRAYGMHTATSDLDVKGVFVPELRYYFGTKKIEQIDDKKLIQDSYFGGMSTSLQDVATNFGMEGTIYEIRRFLDLASGANPNILDVLFSRDEDLIVISDLGRELRKERNKFLTKKCLQTFLGYATAQAKRIETHRKWLLDPPTHAPIRSEFGLLERHEYPQDQVIAALDQVKKQIDRWNIDFCDMDESTKIFIQDQLYKMETEIRIYSDDKFRAAGNMLGIETNFMELIQKQKKYEEAVKTWHAFLTWEKERNEKRKGMEKQIGYDVKHASHLYRLITACRTIFETGELQVYNPDPYLMKIRMGEIRFDELNEKVNQQKDNLSCIATKSNLPSRVNQEWLEDLSIHLVSESNRKELLM